MNLKTQGWQIIGLLHLLLMILIISLVNSGQIPTEQLSKIP